MISLAAPKPASAREGGSKLPHSKLTIGMNDLPTAPPPVKKPRVALAIATGLGLGYIPKAPGTAGSLLGVAIVWALMLNGAPQVDPAGCIGEDTYFATYHFHWLIALLLVAGIGVWAAGVAARYLEQKDPQVLVIDEVSGQMLAFVPVMGLLNWKYLLLGFILFRAFDIWKPFPARAAERLPGGWGIMADDWVAGVYAAIGLLVARAWGL